MSNIAANLYKCVALFVGFVWGVIEPTIPFALICFGAILLDCYTAWRLNKRVAKAHPNKADGKFKSIHAKKVFDSVFTVYGVIFLVYWVDMLIIPTTALFLANGVAGIFTMVQLWSCLENASSCNGAKWAKALQVFLIDKTERHFNLDLNRDGEVGVTPKPKRKRKSS